MRKFTWLSVSVCFLTLFSLLSLSMVPAPTAHATTCTPTGLIRDGINMTAALINPGTVRSTVNATGCNIGVYYGQGARGTVNGAEIFGANYYGVVNDGGTVDILDSNIHDIGETPLGPQKHGVGIAFPREHIESGTIRGNHIWNTQAGGIIVNGTGSRATIQDNVITGRGPIASPQVNGIQVGDGARATIMRNTIVGNSLTANDNASTGIYVFGGPFDPDPYWHGDYTKDTQIVGNILLDNDAGIFLMNYTADFQPADEVTGIKAVNNTIRKDTVTNGIPYQVGVYDTGNGDKIIANDISGAGYEGAPYLLHIDTSLTNRPKVHANH